MVIYYEPYKNIKNIANVTFKFKSLMNGYYCDNNECKQIPLYKTITNKELATYNGNVVTRNSNCFGLCNNIIPIIEKKPKPIKKYSNNIYPIILISIVFIVILILIFIKIYFSYLHRAF
jgi:hypothetical protein